MIVTVSRERAAGRWEDLEDIENEIKTRVKDDFGIGHSTLEFERSDRKHEDAERYGHG